MSDAPSIKKFLSQFSESELHFAEQVNLQKMTTMKLNATGQLLRIKNIPTLQKVLAYFFDHQIPYKMLGWGANLLLPECAEHIYIQLEFPFDRSIFEEVRKEYECPASLSLAVLTSHASKHGLKGWEVFTGIPASLGGAIVMNAGTNLGEIGSVVESVKIVNAQGELREEVIDARSFSYRQNHFLNKGDVVVSAVLKHNGIDTSIRDQIKHYLEMRNKTQPLKEATCGCIFKNKLSSGKVHRAGQYIDLLGLKGLQYHHLQVSLKHANFMENKGDSTYTEVLTFMNIIKDELKLNYGIDFDIEVEY